MKEHKAYPILGIFTSLLSWEIWENILLSFIVAFIGAVAAWMGRRLCDYMYRKYFLNKPPTKHEINN